MKLRPKIAALAATVFACLAAGENIIQERILLIAIAALVALVYELDAVRERRERRAGARRPTDRVAAAATAGGILHNLGNALAPLGANVARLQRALGAAPLEDLDAAVAALERNPADAARKADLERLLRLTGGELAHIVAAARQDADAIARQAETIRQALAQQRPAHPPEPLDGVLLPELIEHSIELVPPALREHLIIECDASLQLAGAVRLDRVTLQQVFQNLIVNAAESVRDAGRGHGLLRITVTTLAAGLGEQLRFCFADDGAGIPPADLARVFDEGFSTKSAATNSGIGLHWCAQVVGELGGRIHAESGGPTPGCRVFVALPLERVLPERRQRVA